MGKKRVPMSFEPEMYDSLDNISRQLGFRCYLKVSPVDMSEDSEHLLVQRLYYGCVEIRREGRIMLGWEKLLV
jgi:hypothetical protein